MYNVIVLYKIHLYHNEYNIVHDNKWTASLALLFSVYCTFQRLSIDCMKRVVIWLQSGIVHVCLNSELVISAL